MTEQVKPVDAKVIELADKITAATTLELVDGKVNAVVDKSVYLDSLKASGLDPEVGKAFREHDNVFMAAAAHSFGQRAQDIQAKKDSPDRIQVKIPTLSRDKLSLVFDKSRISRNPKTKEAIESYGVSAKWVISAGGHYSTVKDSLRRRALDLKIK